MCLDCHASVQREILRAGLYSPDRLLVAIGIVAAERAPRGRLRTISHLVHEQLTWAEADMLFFLAIMFITISGLMIGFTALALATSHLF